MLVLQEEVELMGYEKIKKIIHKIKNNFIYVGASQLFEILVQIENEAKEENIKLKETFIQFKKESESILKLVIIEQDRIKRYLGQ